MNTRLRFVATLTLACLLLAGVAGAQDPRLEAAKKDGKVVWYTSLVLPSAEKVAKLFEAAYPGLKVEVHRTGSQRIIQRVMQELSPSSSRPPRSPSSPRIPPWPGSSQTSRSPGKSSR